MENKVSLWNNYNEENYRYEKDFATAFPWNEEYNDDMPRYIKGDDGYYFCPAHQNSGKALLSFTGDLMCEPDMCRQNRYGDTWFFHPCFQYVRNIFKRSDLVTGNLETTISDHTPYAGQYHVVPTKDDFDYHCNGPESYLEALRYAGYDVLVNANNHVCDSGVTGLFETLRKIDKHGFARTGTFLPSDERFVLIKVKGIKIAILSYATRYNGLDALWTEEGKTNVLNTFSYEKAKADVALAREKGAEFVVSYIHWGRDYLLEPNENQMEILPQLADSGVDFIVGSHTHCLQHFTRVTASSGKVVPVMFSMGNFVTNEFKELCKHTGILQLYLKRENGSIKVEEYFIPCYVFDEMGSGKYTVVPADSYLGGVDCEKLRSVREYVYGRLRANLPEPTTTATTLSEFCDICNLPKGENFDFTPISKLCIKSGAAVSGCVYFSDGNETAQEKLRVIKRRPSAVVSSSQWDKVKNIYCEEPLKAYEKFALYLRSRFSFKTILISGGYGKTELREKLFYALSSKYGTITHPDAPFIDLSVWQDATPATEYCIMETRPDEPADVISNILKPDICIITGAVSENYEETEKYIKNISRSLPENGVLFYNAEDEIVSSVAEKLAIRKSPYSFTAFAKETSLSENALEGYRYKSLHKNALDIDGINLIFDIRAKTEKDIISAIDKAGEYGSFIAVLGEGDINDSLLTEYAKGKGASLIIKADTDEREMEKIILENLKPGDTLLICGGRKYDLNMLLRRLFGITDGYIRGAR